MLGQAVAAAAAAAPGHPTCSPRSCAPHARSAVHAPSEAVAAMRRQMLGLAPAAAHANASSSSSSSSSHAAGGTAAASPMPAAILAPAAAAAAKAAAAASAAPAASPATSTPAAAAGAGSPADWRIASAPATPATAAPAAASRAPGDAGPSAGKLLPQGGASLFRPGHPYGCIPQPPPGVAITHLPPRTGIPLKLAPTRLHPNSCCPPPYAEPLVPVTIETKANMAQRDAGGMQGAGGRRGAGGMRNGTASRLLPHCLLLALARRAAAFAACPQVPAPRGPPVPPGPC